MGRAPGVRAGAASQEGHEAAHRLASVSCGPVPLSRLLITVRAPDPETVLASGPCSPC